VPEAKLCICCEEKATFFVLVMVGTVARSPQSRGKAVSVGACDECCNPRSPMYRKFCSDITLIAWTRRNELVTQLETIPDRKTAAGGE
jgi:hypothetical protein